MRFGLSNGTWHSFLGPNCTHCATPKDSSSVLLPGLLELPVLTSVILEGDPGEVQVLETGPRELVPKAPRVWWAQSNPDWFLSSSYMYFTEVLNFCLVFQFYFSTSISHPFFVVIEMAGDLLHKRCEFTDCTVVLAGGSTSDGSAAHTWLWCSPRVVFFNYGACTLASYSCHSVGVKAHSLCRAHKGTCLRTHIWVIMLSQLLFIWGGLWPSW